jgi:hypothetical protein
VEVLEHGTVLSKTQPRAELFGLSDSPGVMGLAWVSPVESLRVSRRARALEFPWETR